jgi:hypothetical protein
MGVGCFAKPDKLSRVFKRAVESYALGEITGFNGHIDASGNLLDTIIAAIPSGRRELKSEIFSDTSNKRITGFFLIFKNQGLNLSIFLKGDNPQQERFTARLDGLTHLRNNRLN